MDKNNDIKQKQMSLEIEPSLVIACGAIARELQFLKQLNKWRYMKIQCLPAKLHDRPDEIPIAVVTAILKYKNIFIAYADCGTGGLLDMILEKYGLTRLPGAHCYEFFSGSENFLTTSRSCLGTFYLTDFLTRHFDRLVKEGLDLIGHPELIKDYFKNYEKLVYLSQTHSTKLQQMTRLLTKYLGLSYSYEYTGLTFFEKEIKENIIQWNTNALN